MSIMKPFLFVKTIVVWGEDAEDAREHLQNSIDESGDEQGADWSCDEMQSEDLDFIENMGGGVEVED